MVICGDCIARFVMLAQRHEHHQVPGRATTLTTITQHFAFVATYGRTNLPPDLFFFPSIPS